MISDTENFELAARDVRAFVFYPTFACNLECDHCMFSSCPTRTDFAEFELVERGLREIHRNQNWRDCEIGFSGGEITLHPQWREMVRQACDLGFRVGLVTNASGLTDDDAKFLARPDVSIAVSLDGPERHHERLRGPGSWAQTISGLAKLSDAGAQCTINTAVTAESLASLDEFVAFILSSYPNVVGFNIQNIAAHGRARKHPEIVSDEQLLRELFYTCQRLKSEHLEARFSHFLYARDYVRKHPCRVFACSGAKCHSGSSNVPRLFNILPDGTILPLWSLLPRRFSAGNLRTVSLDDAIASYLGGSAHSELLTLTQSIHRKMIKGNAPLFDFAEQAINAARAVN